QVERDDAAGTDGRVEVGHRPLVADRRGEVVAGGEGVLGVEADAEAIAGAGLGAQAAEVLEAPADLRTLTGRVLEGDRGTKPTAGGEHLVEGARRDSETGILSGAAVRTGMRDEVWDREPFASLQLGDHLTHGALTERGVGRRQVEEVRVVREHRVD